MNFPHDQVVFLLETLPQKARKHLSFLEAIGREPVGAIEISGRVVDRILEVLETVPPASIPIPRRNRFQRLLDTIREDKSNRGKPLESLKISLPPCKNLTTPWREKDLFVGRGIACLSGFLER
jgi:hypothetical protein